MSELARRIQDWESFFSKYEKADSKDVYDTENNVWEPVQEEDKRQNFSKDVKKRIDDLWMNDTRQALRNLQQKGKDDLKKTENTSKACDSNETDNYDSCNLDKTKDTTSMKYSSDGDYDSYESEDIQVSKKEFLAALCEKSMSRVCEIQQRREKLHCFFDQHGAKRTSHEIGNDTVALSFPSHQILSPKTSSFEENSSSSFGHRRRLIEGNASPNIIKEKSMTSTEHSFNEHLSRLKLDSPSNKQTENCKLEQVIPDIKSSSENRENFKSKTDETKTTPVMGPADRKRKILLSRGDNCQSSKLPTNDLRVSPSLLNAVLTKNNETRREVPETSPHPNKDEVPYNISIPVQATLSNDKTGARELSLTSPNLLQSSGKTICLDSSVLRKKRNSERKAYRAVMKGRSLFDM